MKSKFTRTAFLSLTILFLMACSFVQSALMPATATPLPTGTATLTLLPPSPTATLTLRPSPLPSSTPDTFATQSAGLAATQAASEASVRAEMRKLGLTVDQGHLAWSAAAPVTLSTQKYGRSQFHNIADGREFADFVFKSDVTWSSKSGLAGCGIGFRISANAAGAPAMYDFFAMRLSGRPDWTFSYFEHGGFTVDLMGQPQVNHLIDASQGGTNSFVLVLKGDSMSAYANGQYLGAAVSDKLQSGSLAWFVSQESGTTSCTFANSWLWELPSKLPPGTSDPNNFGQFQG